MEHYTKLLELFLTPLLTAALTLAGIFFIRNKKRHQNKYMILRKWEVKSFDGSREIYELTDDDVMKNLIDEKEKLIETVKNKDRDLIRLQKELDNLKLSINIAILIFTIILFIITLPKKTYQKIEAFFKRLGSPNDEA
jgi:hypothetical protein